MKELVSSKSAGPWTLNKIPYKMASSKFFSRPLLSGTVIIRNISLWLLLEIFDSQTKVKKKNLETNGKKIKKDINK